LDSITDINSLLKEDEIRDALPNYIQILNQNAKRDKFDYDNFKAPDTVAKIREQCTDASAKMIPMNKTKKIWKNEKVKLDYEVFKEVLHSTQDAK